MVFTDLLVIWGHNFPPLVEIEINNLPEVRVAIAHPAHPSSPTSLTVAKVGSFKFLDTSNCRVLNFNS